MAKTRRRNQGKSLHGAWISEVLGENVRAMRELRHLSQVALVGRMAVLGFAWKQATLSELERGLRPTGVDELCGLALALGTTVVRLLDPAGFEDTLGVSVDLGIPTDVECEPQWNVLDVERMRGLLVWEDAPWGPDVGLVVGWTPDNKLDGGAEYRMTEAAVRRLAARAARAAEKGETP